MVVVVVVVVAPAIRRVHARGYELHNGVIGL
jgi:hypothetical protein